MLPRWPYLTPWCEDLDGYVKSDIDVQLQVGFTESGGVWLLDMNEGQVRHWPQSKGSGNALTMEERCGVLEELGAKFCEEVCC
jgi:hypothetical protein